DTSTSLAQGPLPALEQSLLADELLRDLAEVGHLDRLGHHHLLARVVRDRPAERSLVDQAERTPGLAQAQRRGEPRRPRSDDEHIGRRSYPLRERLRQALPRLHALSPGVPDQAH